MLIYVKIITKIKKIFFLIYVNLCEKKMFFIGQTDVHLKTIARNLTKNTYIKALNK